MASYINPVVTDFKSYFVRDFPYGITSSAVMDSDINNAILDTSLFINSGLFSTQASYTNGFLLLTAHFLVMSLRASTQGIAGQYSWLQASKSVGSVSESFSIPQRILDSPEFSMLSKTNYGAKFIFLILPQLSGQVFAVGGGANA